MTTPSKPLPSQRWMQLLTESAQRSTSLHGQFLHQRQSSLAGMKTLLERQMRAQAGQPALVMPGIHRPALISSAQLDAFGTGRLSDCLGPAFAVYDQRRIPRIPNGDLKMMSRIVSIEASAGKFNQPARVVAEYDVPADAWYLRDQPNHEIPTGLWMEIALQPCGVLSAYLDTYSLLPQGEFYFRNLDGTLRFHQVMPVSGQTIVTQAQMLSSVASSGTVIQKFAFQLLCQGQLLADGESVFGYFSAETMANQQGLDGGKPSLPWNRPENNSPYWIDVSAHQQNASGPSGLCLPTGRLNMLERAYVEKDGGRYGQGYVYASRRNNPRDWYYPCHFYQDPVMPGSLGVEAMLEAMQIYAVSTHVADGLPAPRFGRMVDPTPMSWRYRGQITQQNQNFELEVHLRAPQTTSAGITMQGDASLWIDGLRIYEARDAAISILAE